MTRRLLPLPSRIAILIASRCGPLLILVLAAVAMAALERRAGGFDGTTTGLVMVLGLPLVLTTVGADLRKGVAPLWVQKPVDPVHFYLGKFVEGALASVGLTVVTISVVVAVVSWSGWEPATHPLRPVVVNALFAFVVVSVAFGFCVMVPRGGKLATMTLFGITIAREALVSMDPSGWDWIGSPLVSTVLFPLRPLIELRTVGGVEPESVLGPLAWVICYAVAWVVMGALGIRRAFSRGAWARSA
ncbi:MAG: hypothetical protein OXL34_12235 [Gemmatimonadota bacterium]|nr:hypothetical protein [Gemmatimonadota bacterium]